MALYVICMFIIHTDTVFFIDFNFDEGNTGARSRDSMTKQLAKLILESKQEYVMDQFEKHLEDIMNEEENFYIPIGVERGRREVDENIIQAGLMMGLLPLMKSKELKGNRGDSVPLNEVVITIYSCYF